MNADEALYWAMVNDQIIERDDKLEASFGKPDVRAGRVKSNLRSGPQWEIHDGGEDETV